MKDLVTMTMQSIRKKLNSNDRQFCFELFGYDFIIDQVFKVWLIEINTNPCLEESSKLLKAILPRMIEDMLKLTVDKVFPRKSKDFGAAETNGRKVPGYEDSENMWEPLCQIGIVRTQNEHKGNGSKGQVGGSPVVGKGESK